MTEFLVGARGICMANSTMLRELLRFHKVPAYLNSTVDSITDEGVVVNTPEGQVTVPADTVIMSVGYNPDKTFAPVDEKDPAAKKDNRVRSFVNAYTSKQGPKVYFVGDCDKVGNLKTVIKQAYELVQDLSY